MTTTTITLPDEVIRQDAAYEDTIAAAGGAVVARDRLRWEWTRCPNGPMLSFTAYAKQVGRGVETIRRSAQAVTETPAVGESVTCAYDHDRFVSTAADPTPAEVEAHKDAKHRVTAGEVGGIIVATLSRFTGMSPNTIEHNATWTPLQQEARERVAKEVRLGSAKAAEQIVVICEEVVQAHKQREAAVVRVKRWLAENRSVPASQIPVADAREMVARIERTAARKDLTFADAERETIGWDRKRAAAERIKNQQIAAARLAVLDLRQAAARAKDAGVKMIVAVRKIEDDEVPLSDDERTLALEDLGAAEAAIRLARASLGGESGTDWDAELSRLAGDAR